MTRQYTLLAVAALILPAQAMAETLTEAWNAALTSHHQIAAAAGELDDDDGSRGLTPIATSSVTLVPMWTNGPANEIHACCARLSWRVGVYDA